MGKSGQIISQALSGALCILFCALSACGSGSSGNSGESDATVPHESDVYSQMSVRLDPSLSHGEKSLVIGDLYHALQYQLDAVPGSFFDSAFLGTTNDRVIQYLNQRMHYIIPESVNLDDRVVEASPSQQLFPGLGDRQVYTVALNVGTVLWFNALLSQPQQLAFKEGDSEVPVTSSRVGIVQIYDGYTLKKDGHPAFSTAFRIAALVHEARHSDCTGGLPPADLAMIKNGQVPVDHACGHLHVVCPPGHPYAGIPACDGEAWGAYSIQALYADAIAENCPSCGDTEKMEAQAIVTDSLSRVLVLNDMLDGKLGDPDMSSGGLLANAPQ